ncbi:MAG: hypothetical protein KDD83_01135 [Caldilineaceae bacterium]|nr:hypothetical protein [Caldilineaceae bacterium]
MQQKKPQSPGKAVGDQRVEFLCFEFVQQFNRSITHDGVIVKCHLDDLKIVLLPALHGRFPNLNPKGISGKNPKADAVCLIHLSTCPLTVTIQQDFILIILHPISAVEMLVRNGGKRHLLLLPQQLHHIAAQSMRLRQRQTDCYRLTKECWYWGDGRQSFPRLGMAGRLRQVYQNMPMVWFWDRNVDLETVCREFPDRF